MCSLFPDGHSPEATEGLITARKRSLRRLCFHRCLSVSRQTPPRQTLPPPSWADITPQAETPLGRHPTCPVHAGIHTPCPVHAGIHTPLSSACWDKHPPCPVHAGIRSTSGRYAFHWNAFLLIMWSQVRVSDH